MATRQPICTLLGHVDHGKSSILDKIRGTAIVSREAGGITQCIGCSFVPLKTIEKICGNLLSGLKSSLTIPGLLFIDSPGHAAFTSLRKRGGSLADIAILVVDINEGFKPQTIESIGILKANKVPFVIAANKIDLISGWQYDPKKLLLENIESLPYNVQGQFQTKMYELVGKLEEFELKSDRFDRVADYTKQIAIIPLSGKAGQGIAELLMILIGLAQKYLEKQLKVEEGNAKGTILEVKEEKGLGTTINAIIYDGKLKVNDTLIIANLEEPIVVKIRTLLEPDDLAEMRDKKSKFKNVKQVFAATGVKISAPGLEKAIAGMPLRGTSNEKDVNKLKEEVQKEVEEVVNEDSGEDGVIIKADTIGGLEALRKLLQEKNIPISSSSLGNISKKDLSRQETVRDKNLAYGVILGFNVVMPSEIEELAKNKSLPVFLHEVIYQIIDDYDGFIKRLKEETEKKELSLLVRPCKFALMKGYLFRQSNPAIIGVEIEVGKIKTGDPIMDIEGKRITSVKSLKEGQDNVSVAEQGKQLAMAMDNVTIGRQINEGDFLYTDIPESDFKKLKTLKKYLSEKEKELLKEIVKIKRKSNAVWGVS